MKAAVVYESMYGNTRDIAAAIAEGIGGDATAVEVGEASPDLVRDADLVVVGGPTHAWNMSGRMTRNSAGKQIEGPVVSKTIGVREWLKRLPGATCSFAAFGTRVRQTGRFPSGSSATSIAIALQRKHASLVAQPEPFDVAGMQGPLCDGEVDRAKAWGASLAAAVAQGAPPVHITEPAGVWGWNRTLGIVALLVGLSAVAGGVALLTDVSGGNMGMSLADLRDTPFNDYLVPGLLLLIAVGGSQLLAGLALLSKWPRGPELAVGAGAILTGWIAVQMTMIQFIWLQPAFLVIGVLVMAAGWMARMLRGT